MTNIINLEERREEPDVLPFGEIFGPYILHEINPAITGLTSPHRRTVAQLITETRDAMKAIHNLIVHFYAVFSPGKEWPTTEWIEHPEPNVGRNYRINANLRKAVSLVQADGARSCTLGNLIDRTRSSLIELSGCAVDMRLNEDQDLNVLFNLAMTTRSRLNELRGLLLGFPVEEFSPRYPITTLAKGEIPAGEGVHEHSPE